MKAAPKSPLVSLMGIKLIPSLSMVESAHVGTWLNGYRASKNRSARIKKKLLVGTKKRRPVITAMVQHVPRRYLLQLPNGAVIGHPETIAEVTRQVEGVGAMLGIGRS